MSKSLLKNKNLKMLLTCLIVIAIVYVVYIATKKEGFELSPSDVSKIA